MAGLDDSEERADTILEVAEDVKRYGFFLDAKDLGIVFGPNDLSFGEFLLFDSIRRQRGN